MKKFLTFILVLAMVLSVSSIALADATVNNAADFKEAMAAGGTVTLNGSFELTESIPVPSGVEVVLDLNGFTISMTDSSNAACYMIKNSGNLTIKDGKGEGKLTFKSTTPAPAPNYPYSTSTIGNGGTLTVVSGTIENTTSGGASYAIDNFWYTSDVSTNIEGGKIIGKGVAVRQVLFSTTAMNTLNISGGEINGRVQTHSYNESPALAKVRISGGTINDGASGYAYYTSYTKADCHASTDIEITGGEFTGYLFIYNGNNGSADENFANLSVSGGTFNSGVYIYTTDSSGNDNYIESLSGGEYAVPPYEGMIVPGNAAANVGNGTEDAPFTIEPAKTSGTITIVPASLDFGTVKAGYAQPEAKMISVQGVDDASNKYVTFTVTDGFEVSSVKDNGFASSAKIDVVDGTTTYNVYVRPAANLGAKTYTGSVTVQVNNTSDHPTLDKDNEVALTFAVEAAPAGESTPKPSSGSGISVKYNGGNSFSTSNPAVPTGVEIDGVPVTFNGNGSSFTVGCISSDAKWVTVRWNSTTVTTNFTPDGLVECTTVSIPKTGDMPFWAAVAAFFGF